MITSNEKTYYDGLWTVDVVINGPTGTFVGPFILDLPEDATEADMIAAIQAVIGG